MVERFSPYLVTSAGLGGGAVVGFVLWVYLWVYVRGAAEVCSRDGVVSVCSTTNQHDTGIRAMRGAASGYFLACAVLGVVLESWRRKDSDHNSDSYRYVFAMIMSLISCAANGLSSSPDLDTPFSSFWGRRNNIMRWGQWILVLPLIMYSLETQRGHLLRKRGFPFISILSFWTCVALSFALGTLRAVVAVTSFLTVTVVITLIVGVFAVVELVSGLRVYWGKDDSSGDFIGGFGMDSTIERLVMRPLLQHSMDANTMASHLETRILLELEHRNVVLASLFKVVMIAVVTVQVLSCTDCISVVSETVLSILLDMLAMTIYFLSVYSPELQQDTAKIRDLMLKSDERNSATIKHFFRFVCHEVVPPLSDLTSSIYRIADAAEDWTDADSEFREDVDISVKCCTQMFKTIEDVRNCIVAIDGELFDSYGRAKMIDTLDFKREVRQTAEHYSSRAKTKGIRLILAIDPGIPDAFLGNRVKIKTAVNIIVTTGIDWCDKGGEVVVILRARPHPLDQKATQSVNIHFAVQVSNAAEGMSPASTSLSRLRAQIQENERVLNLGVAAKLVEKEGGALSTAVRNNDKNITISFDMSLALKFPQHNSKLGPLNTEVLASPFSETETANVGYSLDQWGEMESDAPELHHVPGSSQGIDKKELEASPSSRALNAAAAAGLRRIASSETLGGGGGGAKEGAVDAVASVSISTPEISRHPTVSSQLGSEKHAVTISPVTSFSMPTEGVTSIHERPRSVLICDDSPSNRNMCSRLIAKLGYNVEVAENGEQCLKMVINDGSGPTNRPKDFKIPEVNFYRAIILDNEMPVMTGPQTVRLLRAYGYTGLVIGLTGYAMEEDVKMFRTEGCDAIFTKPLNLPEMLRILKVQQLVAPG